MDIQSLLSANLKQGLNPQQQLRALDLIKSGEKYNPNTASELGSYLTGNRYSQLVGKTGSQILGSLDFKPNISNTFDATKLNQSNVQIPQTSVNFDYSNLLNTIGSTSSNLGVTLENLNQITQPAEQERSGLVNRMNTAIDKLMGRSQRTQELMTEYNVTGDVSKLKDINTQIAEKSAALRAGLQAEEGRIAPMEVITGRQAYMQNQAAVELGNLGIIAQALQGNIDLSRQLINDTVDLEYAPIEQEIANLQYQLELNTENLNSAEKKRAEALNLYLTERQSEIALEKEEKTNIRNLALEAIQNGMPTATAQRMMSLKTLDEAVGLAGDYLKSGVAPIKLGEGDMLVDPITGDVIIERKKQDEILSVSEARELGVPYGTTKFQAAQLGVIPQDQLSLSEKIALYKDGLMVDRDGNLVEDPLITTEKDAKQLDINKNYARQLEDKMQLVKELFEDRGIKGAVGTSPFDRLNTKGWGGVLQLLKPLNIIDQADEMLTGDVSNYVAGVQQLIDQETLNTLIELKAAGGTLGQVSEKELRILQNAATRINSWKIEDSSGRVIGYDISEAKFRDELTRVFNSAKKIYNALNQEANNALNKKIDELYPNGFNDDLDSLLDEMGFNQVGGDTNTASNYLSQYGQVTGEGSPYWKWGLDVDLKKGDPVTSPVDGEVIAVANNGGFGKQVKIRDAQGREWWLSHLDGFNVKVGNKVRKGQLVGKGGNTGKVIAGVGGDGSHLDITVKQGGSYLPASQVRKLLS